MSQTPTPTDKKKISKKSQPKSDRFVTTLQIRLSEREKFLLQAKANQAEISMAEVIRSLIVSPSQGYDRQVAKRDLKELSIQVRRIGININQIARWVNSYKSKADAKDVIVCLGEIQEEIKKIHASVFGEGGQEEEGDGDAD